MQFERHTADTVFRGTSSLSCVSFYETYRQKMKLTRLKRTLVIQYVVMIMLPLHGRAASSIFTDGFRAVEWLNMGHALTCVVFDLRNTTSPHKFSDDAAGVLHWVDSLSISVMVDTCILEQTTTAIDHMRRSKRSIFDVFRGIFPGTKWCGLGNAASSYNELGLFSQVDRCCREHDTECQIYVYAGHRTYGVHNDQPYTMSDCRCDEKFRDCLVRVGGTTAELVADLFFNVIKTKCLRVRPVSSSNSRVGIVADVQEPTPFKKKTISAIIGSTLVKAGHFLGKLFGR